MQGVVTGNGTMRSIINGFSGRVLNPCEHNCSNRPLDNSLQDYFLNTVLLSSTMTVWESILGITGFKKSYNFILFFIFAGGLFGFTLSRLQYLDITGRYASGTAPGEWFHQHTGFRKVGITLHLGTILPCAILLIFQFIPSIRHRAILFHRINGYIIITLFLISNAGALMIAPPRFQRRARCATSHRPALAYPMCAPPSNGSSLPPGYDPVAIVKADDNGVEPAQIGANLSMSFGLALWLAMFMHIVGVEIYLQLTPRESQRLRMVSYERQKEAGAGLVVQKFGDAEPWDPSVEAGQPI
ncbi:conserved hypothetical protein [Histoplasma capsulatum H143]|uniref:Uncharacterized protein n=1 Tax=Ajellomyces capsulatus (strain H143) TaxID=544712 RepID=C6H7D1_AJECH|nr:conserved hypothetical protein [Histoplasma capsulatum H143]